MTPVFFESPAAFRSWLHRHHRRADELWVGFYKRKTGRPSLTWPESVDEALCFGWIDGMRRALDGERYVIRFTPRKPRSKWSAINLRRVAALAEAGRMRPAGLRAFEARVMAPADYSYETRSSVRLSPADERRFRRNAKAWAFFEARPPGYRRLALWWVVNAKREETRRARLETLIADSARGELIGPMRRPPRR